MKKSEHQKIMDGETINGLSKPQITIHVRFEQIKSIIKNLWKHKN
jgi:hypothetical protein